MYLMKTWHTAAGRDVSSESEKVNSSQPTKSLYMIPYNKASAYGTETNLNRDGWDLYFSVSRTLVKMCKSTKTSKQE